MRWVWTTVSQSEITNRGLLSGVNESNQSGQRGCGLRSARHPAAREEKRAQEVEVFVTKWLVGLIGRGWAGAEARFQVLSPEALQALL